MIYPVRHSVAARSAGLLLALIAGAALHSPTAAAPRSVQHAGNGFRRSPVPRVLKAAPFRPASAPQEKYARGLLRQMLQAEQRVALAGDQVTSLMRNGQVVTSEQNVIRNGTHAFRLQYVQPPGLAGETIIDNGHTYWHYSPVGKKLEVGPSRIDHMQGRVPQVMQQIKQGSLVVQYLGQDTVAGKNCAVIEVSSRDLTQAPRRRFWVDPTNGAQLRIDEFGADGQLQSSSYYNSITYDPTLAPDTFAAPSAPKGTRVTAPELTTPTLTVAQAQIQAGFPLQQPTYLPNGFHFQGASVSDFRRQKLIALRYVNGLNVLSLYENPLGPRGANQPARLTRPRPGVLILVQNGLRFILVGNLSQQEMEKVVISVH